MHIGLAQRSQRQLRRLRAVQQTVVQARIRVDRYRSALTHRRRHQTQHTIALLRVASGLFVARSDACLIRFDPYLEKMRGFVLCVVEFTVPHASTRTHALHMAGRNALHVAHAVLVRQIAGQNITDDFHVTVRVCAKAGPRGNPVFIDHPEIAPGHVQRVVIPGEGKAVKRLQPAMVGVATFGGFA